LVGAPPVTQSWDVASKSDAEIDEMLGPLATADTDEAGHAFQFEVGHLYRSEAGHRSDLMSATGGLLPRIEVDDV
jgi:hypothetical protein